MDIRTESARDDVHHAHLAALTVLRTLTDKARRVDDAAAQLPTRAEPLRVIADRMRDVIAAVREVERDLNGVDAALRPVPDPTVAEAVATPGRSTTVATPSWCDDH